MCAMGCNYYGLASDRSTLEPKEAYTKVREKVLELEIEKEEQTKAFEYMKLLRAKEKESLAKDLEHVKTQN
jgi:hypothetical protein